MLCLLAQLCLTHELFLHILMHEGISFHFNWWEKINQRLISYTLLALAASGSILDALFFSKWVTAPLLNAREHVWVSWILGYDHYVYTDSPCHSKEPSLLNGHECRVLVKIWLPAQYWRLHTSEKFSSWTKTTKQNNNQTNFWTSISDNIVHVCT